MCSFNFMSSFYVLALSLDLKPFSQELERNSKWATDFAVQHLLESQDLTKHGIEKILVMEISDIDISLMHNLFTALF